MKTFFAFILGSVVGSTLATWLAPKTIAWYFEPPVEIGINCRPATEWAMTQLIRAQGFGLIGGAMIVGVAYILWKKKKSGEFKSTISPH